MIQLHTSDTIASLRALEHELDIVSRQALGQAATFALVHARATTKFKDRTTKLRGTLERRQHGPYELSVIAGAHALFVEEDTKAHVIRPKRTGSVSSRRSSGRRAGPQLLTFQIGGRWISKASVNHPGTTGTHFMRDARDASELELSRYVEFGLNRFIAG
jgi:hypothetical protein